jgi:hypothetical protein
MEVRASWRKLDEGRKTVARSAQAALGVPDGPDSALARRMVGIVTPDLHNFGDVAQ